MQHGEIGLENGKMKGIMAQNHGSTLPSLATKSATPTLASSLPAKLNELLVSSETPIVGPETAKALAEYARQPEPPRAGKGEVEVMIGKLAIATAQPKASAAEAAERLDLYWLALSDIPLDDLRRAFVDILRTATFLPTPAEVRKAAVIIGNRRNHLKSRARFLAWKHAMEWTPPVEIAAPGELDRIKAEVASAFPSNRA